MELVFGFLAGILTLLNPCVLPVLPVVLISALNQHKFGPLYLCAGMSLTFVSVGMFVAAIGPVLGIDQRLISQVASSLMILFGLILLVPVLSVRFAVVAGGASSILASKTSDVDSNGFGGQFITGMLLGAVWSPCIGPTLGGAIAMASQGNDLVWAGAIMTAFALGVSTVILILSIASREALFRHRDSLQRASLAARPIMGGILVLLGFFLFFGLHHSVEAWAVENLPYWLQDLSVRF